ncbi:hypothetical protein V1477_009082 [Vespula maculifrons]|uniref:Uncharacterized protein n=1 Tax=Vespula maculifrons TaxID=7453 RepID=A0ABD2CEV9_VESMC
MAYNNYYTYYDGLAKYFDRKVDVLATIYQRDDFHFPKKKRKRETKSFAFFILKTSVTLEAKSLIYVGGIATR